MRNYDRINFERDKIMKITVLDRKSMGLDLDFSSLTNVLPNAELEIHDTTLTDAIQNRIQDTDVIILNKVKITGDVLRNCSRLKLICVFATGFDNIDIKTAKEKGIAVCNVPAYSTESVLLLTISTALSLAAKIPTFQRYVNDGSYTESRTPNYLTPVFHECKGLTWGIIGCGHIGSRVAEVAKTLGMRVLVYQRHPSSYENVDLQTLCKQSDIISLHCPLNDQTRFLIGTNELSVMKDTCILVNEARGAVVDESAVAKALSEGKIGAYGSDVYCIEPFPKEHPFYSIKGMDNLLLTPHVAWAAYESRVRCLQIISENINAFFNNNIKNRVEI